VSASSTSSASNHTGHQLSSFSHNQGWTAAAAAAAGTNNNINEPTATATNEQVDQYAQNGIVGPWSAFSASLLGDMALTSENNNNKSKKKDAANSKPKRPLSAYNVFFKEERNRILDTIPDSEAKEPSKSTRKRKKRPHGKIGFESLAKAIGKRWQSLSVEELAIYKAKAQEDMKRYKAEMEVHVDSEAKQKHDVSMMATSASASTGTVMMGQHAQSNNGGGAADEMTLFADRFFEPSAGAKKARMSPNMFRL
jgi:hypothetical protein